LSIKHPLGGFSGTADGGTYFGVGPVSPNSATREKSTVLVVLEYVDFSLEGGVLDPKVTGVT
jgi:hypothetical protein